MYAILKAQIATDHCLCFHYISISTIPLNPKLDSLNPKLDLSIQLSSVAAQPVLCRTLQETLKTAFLMTQLISCRSIVLNKLQLNIDTKLVLLTTEASCQLEILAIYAHQQTIIVQAFDVHTYKVQISLILNETSHIMRKLTFCILG